MLHVAFWNVHNLFDGLVQRGPRPQDVDAKLDVVAKAIAEFFDGQADLIALAEIGDDTLVTRLLSRFPSRKYEFKWQPAPKSDQTGLCVLRRCTGKAAVTDFDIIEHWQPATLVRPHIIVVECVLRGSKTPAILAVNHWKSRLPSDGTDGAQDRLDAGRWLGDWIDKRQGNDCLVAVGDFNAEPFEPPFGEIALRGKRHFSSVTSGSAAKVNLYNASWRFLAEPRMWETIGPAGMADPVPKTSWEKQFAIFDQILVSRAALLGQPLRLRESSVRYHVSPTVAGIRRSGVLKPLPWIIDPQTNQPRGASDHFPLLASFDVVG